MTIWHICIDPKSHNLRSRLHFLASPFVQHIIALAALRTVECCWGGESEETSPSTRAWTPPTETLFPGPPMTEAPPSATDGPLGDALSPVAGEICGLVRCRKVCLC